MKLIMLSVAWALVLSLSVAVAAEPVAPPQAPSQQQAAAPAKPPAATAKTNASEALASLSKSINGFHFGAVQLVTEFHNGTVKVSQAVSQLKNTHERNVWAIILGKCAIVLGLSYAVFFCGGRLTLKIGRWFPASPAKPVLTRIIHLFTQWILHLLPIAIFAITAYFSLILLHVGEKAQWILLAWISAFLITKVLLATMDFLCAAVAAFPGFFAASDGAIHFFKKWLAFWIALIVYGYFILQIVLFLEIPPETYAALYKILGLLVLISLILFIIRIPLWGAVRIEMVVRTVAVVYLFLLYVAWIMQADHFFWFVVKGTVLSLALLFLAMKITQFLHRRLIQNFQVTPLLKKRLPGLERRFKRYRRALDVILRTFIYITTALIILKIWQGPGFSWLPERLREVLIIKIISILGIALTVMLLWEMSNSLIEMWLTKNGGDISFESGRTHTLLTVARRTILITLSLIALLMVLSELGVNIGPLLAGAGVLGLAVSFGAQKLMQDLITGFFMLLENQIAVGDVVRIGDMSGVVEAIAVRTLRLRDTGGIVHIIPYSSIVTVSNLTKDFSYYLFEISVAYRENVDEVIAVLRQIGEELQRDPAYQPLILEPLDVLGLDKFADSAVVIKARLKTKPALQWQVGREFNRRMKQKFDELDIQIPFPHTVIFFGENKNGAAPAAHIQIDS